MSGWCGWCGWWWWPGSRSPRCCLVGESTSCFPFGTYRVLLAYFSRTAIRRCLASSFSCLVGAMERMACLVLLLPVVVLPRFLPRFSFRCDTPSRAIIREVELPKAAPPDDLLFASRRVAPFLALWVAFSFCGTVVSFSFLRGRRRRGRPPDARDDVVVAANCSCCCSTVARNRFCSATNRWHRSVNSAN